MPSAKSNRINRWMPVALALALLSLGYYLIKVAPLPFIQSWWQQGDVEWTDPWHKRHRLADGLLFSGRLIGKTRAEIVALLGEPSETNYHSEWDIAYALGSARAFIPMDIEWLVIRLDSNGVATEASLAWD